MCSYAQGYNIIRAKSQEQGWDIDLGALARIWKGGCIIRAGVFCWDAELFRDMQGGGLPLVGLCSFIPCCCSCTVLRAR